MAILRDVLTKRIIDKASATKAALSLSASFQKDYFDGYEWQSFPTYKWNTAKGRYENKATGEVVSEESLWGVGQSYTTNITASVGRLTDRFIDGEITLSQWQHRMAAELKDAHLVVYQISRGGKKNMDFSDYGRVGGVLRWEYARLEQFAIEIAADNLTDAQIKARAQLYVGSVRKAYWGARTAAMKAAGYDEEIRVLTPDETCEDCIRMAALKWQPIGSLPEPGQDSVCDGNCKCAKEYRKSKYVKEQVKIIEDVYGKPEVRTIEEILADVPELPPLDYDLDYLDPGYPEEIPWHVGEEAQDWLRHSNVSAGVAKDDIVLELSERTGIPYEHMNELIKQWSYTSNDEAYGALEIQKVAAEMFGTELSDWQQGKYDEIFAERERAIAGDFPAGFNRSKASVFEIKPGQLYDSIPDRFESSEEAVESTLRAMYDHTQDELKAAGIEEVYIFRGTTGQFYLEGTLEDQLELVSTALTKDGVQLDSNVLESWTAVQRTAEDFADNNDYGILIYAEVPANRVIGSARTGFGCLSEQEFVIIGNMPNDEIRIEKLVGLDWRVAKAAYDPFGDPFAD